MQKPQLRRSLGEFLSQRRRRHATALVFTELQSRLSGATHTCKRGKSNPHSCDPM
jgi:hypothetical protein